MLRIGIRRSGSCRTEQVGFLDIILTNYTPVRGSLLPSMHRTGLLLQRIEIVEAKRRTFYLLSRNWLRERRDLTCSTRNRKVCHMAKGR